MGASFEVRDIRGEESVLGPKWSAIYSGGVKFESEHFLTAMMNIIRQPNVNSTVIMRADILREERLDRDTGEFVLVSEDNSDIDHTSMPLSHRLDDVTPRRIDTTLDLPLTACIVRRIIPRNPRRDPVVIQTCLVYSSDEMTVVAYVPHISAPENCPYYLPPAKAVAVIYRAHEISVHYIPFDEEPGQMTQVETTERPIRIALRLLQTANKHSQGVMDGYQKRVYHDVVVDKVSFQDRYIVLKQKYAQELTANWVESTDPKKHVFEDLAIAAFLVELWKQMYDSKDSFTFLDLGCGNGLLVHILLLEGYRGIGVDARARKSWKTYPQACQDNLKEQVVIPKELIDSENQDLLEDPMVNTLDLSPNTFIIGNHSDELTLWVPLIGCPFMVIPCCSHALSGAKHRFPAKCPENKSTYASLVDHVQDISTDAGWKVEKERLRIPSTRNAALIGRFRQEPRLSVPEILAKEGGAEGWIQRAKALRGKSPRSH
ncbi:hypothetical protein TRICI_003428 [Trichomonascus ciferrii]|uniref:tRNA (uracil-O(2)-)-methyltransferase n=1 Tax=Trichomonascus ciferrii TaxID=44093 RepID=A0A642V343_9ASCO|nr:hypothetical protein TRICI_003428 [Trichomonascus ciferrii]